MEQEITLASPDAIIAKLKRKLGLNKDMELATFLKVKANTISSWKKRGTIAHNRILELCIQHNFDLNEVLCTNSRVHAWEEAGTKIPILMIDNYLEYYLHTDPDSMNLPFVYYSNKVDFSIIIQVLVMDQPYSLSQLMYVFCKKIQIEAISDLNEYVIIVKEKGFIYCKLTEIEDLVLHLLVEKDQKTQVVKRKDIIEVFLCIERYTKVKEQYSDFTKQR